MDRGLSRGQARIRRPLRALLLQSGSTAPNRMTPAELGHPDHPNRFATVLRLSRGLFKQEVKQMHGMLLRPEYDHLRRMSAALVEKICQLHSRSTRARKPKEKPWWCRYEANHRNLI
jgi:hypothetical protein